MTARPVPLAFRTVAILGGVLLLQLAWGAGLWMGLGVALAAAPLALGLVARASRGSPRPRVGLGRSAGRLRGRPSPRAGQGR